MSSRPTVSVIVATCRREKLVTEAIQSALDQSDVSVEVIVVDDSGTASARSAVEGMGDPRVRYVAREQNSGKRPGVVRNDGAARATSEFLHFLDDDDRLADRALALLTSALAANSHMGMAFGRVAPFGEYPQVLDRENRYFDAAARSARKLNGSRARFAGQLLFGDTCLINSACLVRRRVHSELGGYDPTVPVIEDIDFFLHAGRRYGFTYVDAPVLHYRTGEPSITNAPAIRDQVLVGFRRMYDKYKGRYGAAEFYGLKLAMRGRAALARLAALSRRNRA